MPRRKKTSNSLDDQARCIAFAEYLLRILLQIPKPSEGSVNRLGDRFIAEFLFGLDYRYNVSTRSAKQKGEIAGSNFRKGLKITTIREVVDLLSFIQPRIKNYSVQTEKPEKTLDRSDVRLPTAEQILEALLIFTRLSPAELHALSLPSYAQHSLLQRAFINLAVLPVFEGQKLPDVYRTVYHLSLNQSQTSNLEVPFHTWRELEDYIADGDTLINREQYSMDSKRRTLSALNKLLLQAGTGQARFLKLDDQQDYIRNYLSKAFVERLLSTISTNNQLRERLPFYLKSLTIEPIGPFPLPKPDDDPRNALLSKTLLSLQLPDKPGGAPVDGLFEQLPTRSVIRASGQFYVRLKGLEIARKKNYQGFDYDVHLKMRQQAGDSIQIHFSVSTSGIGGSNSLISKVLNQALISDVTGLREIYFPIAHDLFVKQTNVNQRVLSPVSNHSYVQLCSTETVATAMKASSKASGIARYEDFGSYDPCGAGDYSDFDMLMSAGNASLLARLQAIANTGIDTQSYIFSVLARVEQQYLLDEAKSLLTGYPFSSFALTSSLRSKLLEKTPPRSRDAQSYLLHNARMTIVETFLTEGAYRKAFEHLERLHQDLKQDSDDGINWLADYETRSSTETTKTSDHLEEEIAFRVVSGQVLARYEICLTRYLMVLDADMEQSEGQYFLDLFDIDESRSKANLVSKAWNHLTRAEQHLTVRQIKYHIIDEISQATFQPYYHLLAQIYFRRARLFLWYPNRMAPKGAEWRPPTQKQGLSRDSSVHAARGRLFLFERARAFAACGENSALYTICTTYQCRVWLMTAFTLRGSVLTFSDIGYPTQFNKQKCLAWAKKLRNDSLLQYAPIGQRCYNEVKEKSGLEKTVLNPPYGRCSVEPVAAIRETFKGHEPGYDSRNEVLFLDMEYLALRRHAVDDDNPDSSQVIYLFGPQSCHLFLIRGLYHLSTNSIEEFSRANELPSYATSVSAWDKKLEQCYYLFNYAWSIAGNGCGIDSSEEPNIDRKITRQMSLDDQGMENCIRNNHAKSVWNLYPHRITEIADVGKVFAAACAVLRFYAAADMSDKQYRRQEVEALLSSLPNVPGYHLDASLQAANEGQSRLNGHLVDYLTRCSKIIREVVDSTGHEGSMTWQTIASRRDTLLESLFSVNAL